MRLNDLRWTLFVVRQRKRECTAEGDNREHVLRKREEESERDSGERCANTKLQTKKSNLDAEDKGDHSEQLADKLIN